MVGLFISVAVLFGALKLLVALFERERDDLDNFAIAMVAVVPVILSTIVAALLGLLVPVAFLLAFLPPVVLYGGIFLLLWKNLDIPIVRSVAYSVALFVVHNLVLGLFLFAVAPR